MIKVINKNESEGMLQCTACQEWKAEIDFYKRPDFTRGYAYSCKACTSHREKIRAQKKKKNAGKKDYGLAEINTLAQPKTLSRILLSLPMSKLNKQDIVKAARSSMQLPLFEMRHDLHSC